MSEARKLTSADLLNLQHRLKVWSPNEESEEQGSPPGQLSPRMTLQQFFDAYYLPVELEANDRSHKTIGLYRKSLKRWTKLTDDAPLWKINAQFVADYIKKLREDTWRRGMRGLERKLSPSTIAQDLRNIRALIYRIGPQTDPKRETQALIEKAPHIRVEVPRTTIKPAISVARAKSMILAATDMTKPMGTSVPPALFWCGFVAASFYAGQREGTTLGLRRRHWIKDEEGLNWLDITSEIVPKTEKPTRVLMHPCLIEVFRLICTYISDDPETLILEYPHDDRTFNDHHEILQKLAGIPVQHRLSPQAWRRTHGVELGRLGYSSSMRIASAALDHGDVATTSSFYCNLANELRLKLPRLWTTLPSADRQKTLFDI